MIGEAFDYAADIIGDAFNLDDKKVRVVRLALIVGAGYFALKFVRSMIARKD